MQQDITDANITGKQLFKIQLFALVAGAVILLFKFGAYFLTHSNTIFTDALESIINVAAAAFALLSIYIASQPIDADHPYGHGKVEFLSAGFEGILIMLAGGSIITKSVFAFFHPYSLENLNIGLAIVIVSGLANYGIGWWLQTYGKKHHSLTLQADGEHLKSDAYSSLAVLAGLLLVLLTGWRWIDNVAAILIGTFILYTGAKLLRKSIAGIMDESDDEIVESIITSISIHRKPQWIDVHNMRVIQYGSKWHVDCHVTLPWYYTLQQAHDEIEEIARLVNEQNADRVEFFIHADSCISASCTVCSLQNCAHRKSLQNTSVEWNLENVKRNKKHGLV